MKAVKELPQNYKEIISIDLQKNKKLSLFVNLLAVAVAVIMVIPACFFVPISALFEFGDNPFALLIRCGVLVVSLIAYIILHELVHGVAMKMCGTKKVKYGFTGLYAFAGSEDFYDKRGYIFIALAPVILWGAVLAVMNAFVPEEWFWVVYLIQITNISGAAGDAYVTAKFSRLPKDILVHDYGVGMTVYWGEGERAA